MDTNQLRIKGDRLRGAMEEMAQIGATAGGGVHRLALTDEDKRARDLFVHWLEEIDLAVWVDEMGNIFGRMAGQDDDLPPVMAGSHLDSQPKGGRFDGVLGVMTALEAFRTIHENGVRPKRPMVIVNWTNEEGSRFPPAMMASGVWAGKLDRDRVYDRRDTAGKRFVDELERIGYRGDRPAERFPFHAYWELHIEQGPVLDSLNRTIGVPEGIYCVHWYDVHLTGTANQVGPTPMEGRNDALCAAAEMILAVNGLPIKMGGNMVATVGEIHNQPNSRNIIPDRVRFTVDIRSWDTDLALSAWDELSAQFERIASSRGCPMDAKITWRVENTPFDPDLVETVRRAADGLAYSRQELVSGAGHDASYMTMCGPTAMIFVPSIGGRSHVEVENTGWEDCEAGANVLLRCLLDSAAQG
jgi:N-carbamoyl-L-amino-acid hydrolase